MFSYVNTVALQYMQRIRLKNVSWYEIVFRVCSGQSYLLQFNSYLAHIYLTISVSNLLFIRKWCLGQSNDPLLLDQARQLLGSVLKQELVGAAVPQHRGAHARNCSRSLTVAAAASLCCIVAGSVLCLLFFSNKSTKTSLQTGQNLTLHIRHVKQNQAVSSVASNWLHLSAKQ